VNTDAFLHCRIEKYGRFVITLSLLLPVLFIVPPWYGRVLRKEDDDWVKECMEYEVGGPRPKRTWREVVKEDSQARKLNKEDAMDGSKWRKLINR